MFVQPVADVVDRFGGRRWKSFAIFDGDEDIGCLTAPARREPLKGRTGFEAETVRGIVKGIHPHALRRAYPDGMQLWTRSARRTLASVGETCFSHRAGQRGDVAVHMQP